MSTRDPKWQRLQQGTLVRKGQPFRVEYPGTPFDPIDHQGARADWVFQDFGPNSEWFVDSWWRCCGEWNDEWEVECEREMGHEDWHVSYASTAATLTWNEGLTRRGKP